MKKMQLTICFSSTLFQVQKWAKNLENENHFLDTKELKQNMSENLVNRFRIKKLRMFNSVYHKLFETNKTEMRRSFAAAARRPQKMQAMSYK